MICQKETACNTGHRGRIAMETPRHEETPLLYRGSVRGLSPGPGV